MCNEHSFLPGESIRRLNVSFEAGEILVSYLKVRVGKTPVIRSCIGRGWVVADASEIFDDFIPYPVAMLIRKILFIRGKYPAESYPVTKKSVASKPWAARSLMPGGSNPVSLSSITCC